MTSIALDPTPFTAPSPKRILSPRTVKPSSLSFTSGGRTGISRKRHSAMFLYVLLVWLFESGRREVLHLIEELAREFVRELLLGRAFEKTRAFFLHDLLFLLPHS